MTVLWARAVLKLFPGMLRVNGRLVLVDDGIKVAKQGRKMPAVKLLHQESEDYRKAVKRKVRAYHVFVHAGIVSQGLLHYLAWCYPKQVWRSFGSWLRTIRPGIAPSELDVFRTAYG